MKTSVQVPKYMKDYDRAGLLLVASCWSTGLGCLVALISYLSSSAPWWAGYLAGVSIGVFAAWVWRLRPVSRDMWVRHMEFFEGTPEREVRRHTSNYYRWALLANPVVVGPVYVVYRLMKFSTAWIWLSTISFGLMGLLAGYFFWPGHIALACGPLAFVGGLLAYVRRQYHVPDFPKRNREGLVK